MWILHWLPDSFILDIVYIVMGIGASLTLVSILFINTVLRYLPGLSSYYKLVQFVGVTLLALGIYLWGGYSTEMQWRERVAEMEAKVKASEEKAPVITKEIVTKYKDKIVVVKQGVEIIKKEIEVKREIINEGCKLNPTAVEMYNKGITGPKEESK